MPDVHIPQTSSWVTWPGSKRGDVHITAALPLRGLARSSSAPKLLRHLRTELHKGAIKRAGNYVPIELKFSRRSFDLMVQTAAYFHEAHPLEEEAVIRAHLPKHMRAVIGCSPQELLSDWADSIVETLHYYGLHCGGQQSRPTMEARWMVGLLPDPEDSNYRKPKQTLKSEFGGVPFRLVVRRLGLRALGVLCSTPEGKRDLALAVQGHLLPAILAELGSKPLPRGRHHIEAKFLQHTAAVAIFMARRLIAKVAGGDDALRRKLAPIINSSVRSSSARRQHTMALELAERTLRPAWDQPKIPPHLRHTLNGLFSTASPQQCATLEKAWFDRLLGPPGQAAKDLDLL